VDAVNFGMKKEKNINAKLNHPKKLDKPPIAFQISSIFLFLFVFL